MGLQPSYLDGQTDNQTHVEEANEPERFLYCVACQYPITRPTDRMSQQGQHTHVFANPHGHIFQIGCFAEAMGCVVVTPPSSEFTWFAGYTWQVVLCKQCHTMLGWFFRSSDAYFWGLIVDKLKE